MVFLEAIFSVSIGRSSSGLRNGNPELRCSLALRHAPPTFSQISSVGFSGLDTYGTGRVLLFLCDSAQVNARKSVQLNARKSVQMNARKSVQIDDPKSKG